MPCHTEIPARFDYKSWFERNVAKRTVAALEARDAALQRNTRIRRWRIWRNTSAIVLNYCGTRLFPAR